MEKSWKDAIIEVLRQAGEAMHYADIADQIVERGLRSELTATATPANSVAATIAMSFRNEGASSPFVRAARGFYTIRELQQESSSNQPEEPAESNASETTGVVNAFGMFWERGKVLWESRPRLLGQQQGASVSVDFRDQRGVYLLHDAQGVVYVGRATDQGLGTRLYQHTLDRLNGRWTRFSWFGIYPVTAKGDLNTSINLNVKDPAVLIATMEAVLIEGLEPRQNRRQGDDFRAIEYLQYEDPKLEVDRKIAIFQELADKLKTQQLSR